MRALIDSIDSSQAPPTGPRLELAVHHRVALGELVERLVELADDALAAGAQADLEVTITGLTERVEKVLEQRNVDGGLGVAVHVGRAPLGSPRRRGARRSRRLRGRARGRARALRGCLRPARRRRRALARLAPRLRHRYSFAWVRQIPTNHAG
jgi:hypothetical protein